MVNNLDWLGELSLIEFLRGTGKHFTVPYMLAKDSVQVRLERGLSFTEFSYMLLQSYDFAHLYRTMGVELQMGGADQWGNITAGLELIRRTAGLDDDAEPAHGLAYKLLLTPSGTKFGKSEVGDSVWLDPARTSPYAFYQYWLKTDDRDIGTYLRWFTEFPRERIEALESDAAHTPEGRPAQRALALDITARTHGAEAAARAVADSEAKFSNEAIDDPAVLRLAVRVGRRVPVRTGGACHRGGGRAGRRRPRRIEGRGSPPDRRRRRHDQRRAGDGPGVHPRADRRGVAGRAHRQAPARDRPAGRRRLGLGVPFPRGVAATRGRRGRRAVRARAPRGGPARDTAGRPSRRRARRGSRSGPCRRARPRRRRRPARSTSVASSVTFRPTASTPPSRRDVVYEPAGRSAARAAIVAHSVSSHAKPCIERSAGAPSGSKQLRVSR